MATKKLMKGLLGASALMALSTGTAFAQNNFTPAGEDVDNTFNLEYQVGAVAQPPITNAGAPTTFKVDRLVNVTVAASAATVNVAPGQTDAFLTYTVTNNGNDTHRYLLTLEQESANDDFDSNNPASVAVIRYQVGGTGPFINYDPADPPTSGA